MWGGWDLRVPDGRSLGDPFRGSRGQGTDVVEGRAGWLRFGGAEGGGDLVIRQARQPRPDLGEWQVLLLEPADEPQVVAEAVEEAAQLLAQAERPIIIAGVEIHRFGLADIAVGDFVEVDAYQDEDGFVATKVERDDADDDEVKLEGRPENVAPPDFTIGGVKVTTDANTQFRNDNGDSISSSTFFAAAAGGAVVEVRGTLVGDTVLAMEAELDD